MGRKRERERERKFSPCDRGAEQRDCLPFPSTRRGGAAHLVCPPTIGARDETGHAVVCRPTRPQVLPHTRHTGHTSHTTYVGRHATSAHACECTAFRTNQYREYTICLPRVQHATANLLWKLRHVNQPRGNARTNPEESRLLLSTRLLCSSSSCSSSSRLSNCHACRHVTVPSVHENPFASRSIGVISPPDKKSIEFGRKVRE